MWIFISNVKEGTFSHFIKIRFRISSNFLFLNVFRLVITQGRSEASQNVSKPNLKIDDFRWWLWYLGFWRFLNDFTSRFRWENANIGQNRWKSIKIGRNHQDIAPHITLGVPGTFLEQIWKIDFSWWFLWFWWFWDDFWRMLPFDFL